MFKKIAIAIVVLIAAVLGYAAMQPDTFRIQRSARIQAPPERIFAVLNDFQQSPSWSPYEKKDPSMKRAFSGAPVGKGSVYEFDGNKDVGAGRIEIVESLPRKKVTLQLDMIKPFKARNIVEYTLEPRGDATEVTWAMHGNAPFLSKLICLFMDMDKMVGTDFEVGLANLKAVTEGQATGPV
jgi:carbon monoxide dehydrogenase subunit G